VRALLVALALLLWPLAVAGEADLEQSTVAGPVRATVRVSPKRPVIGDAVTLEIEVRAESGVELLMPEFGEALDRFAIVDFVPSERVDDEGGTIAVQRYRLQPSRSGAQVIPPILIEFVDRRTGQAPAPEGEDAFELLTESMEFDVESVLPEDAPLELRPARGALPPLAPPGRPLWPFVVVALAVLGALSPFAVRAWLSYRARERRRTASEVALGELDALLAGPRPAPAEMDAFFVKLSGIVRRYLENRFGLRSPELTTEEFLDLMSSAPDLSHDHRAVLRSFLRRADLVKFAHHVPDPASVEESIQAARRFLEETREDAPPLGAHPAEVAGV
jgi:HAMP domain-containing protein